MQSLQQSWEQPPIFFISSAITKAGRKEILEHIEKLKTH
jgi:hypothetical protein